MHITRLTIAVLVGIWAGSPSSGAEPDEVIAANAAYRLGPGDVVDISVFEVEELSKPAVLSPDGTVSLPLIGVVSLGGLTARDAAQQLRTLYSDNLIRNPQVSVIVKEYQSQPVAVLGAVSKPGVYQLRGPRQLSDVLALAQGLAPDAGAEITISRPDPARPDDRIRPDAAGDQTISVPVSGLLRLDSGPQSNPLIQANDTVRVSKAGIVYVVGDVGRAGGFPLKDQEQITVLKALSLAEGLLRTAAPQKAKIIHKQADVQKETPVRIKDILEGRSPDVPLLPDDVLFIPNSQAKSAMGRATEAAIQITTGIIVWRR